jgi:Uma2 family endonuclease
MIMQVGASKLFSPDEYLELEINSEERHEYIRGDIIKMTGGTPNHNQIALNLSGSLNFALRKNPYHVFVTDQRVWIPEARIYTYPDVMVMAEPLEYAENRRDTLTNPLLIAEVLSKSTRAYDKDDKFATYRTIPSFQEYLLIDKYRIHIDHYSKTEPHKWVFIEYDNPQAILSLFSLNFQIEIAEIYDKVDFNIEE